MTTTTNRKAWHHPPLEDRDAVLQELREILASPQFCNSKRYPALLQYIVENTLAGKADLLKERTIGVEVFDRPPAYDTNADTVVRFTAGEVRKRLAAYYHENGRASRIHISLPPGSYEPEFLYREELREETQGDILSAAAPAAEDGGRAEWANTAPDAGAASIAPPGSLTAQQVPGTRLSSGEPSRRLAGSRRLMVWALAALLAVALLAVSAWKYWPAQPESAVDDFWRPILRDRGKILLCAGGNVFAQSPVPGFITAGKETDYPYFSLQTATSITLLSTLIERNGATPQFDFAASTPLPDLHEHPIILLNAYNNQWTLRLSQPLRFHFAPQSDHGIVDTMQPQVHWARDPSVPYSSADDYALMARFWDSTTDNWVVVLAGLGRNGTEAATQFVVSPHYMQLLRDQMGRDFSKRNIEVVLKVNVIDGKTGAPTILAVHSW
jgi:hypothetical protein